MLEAHARRTPQAVALDDTRVARSWAELDDRVRRIARALQDEWGLRPGDHAATLMFNRVECVELMHAAIRAGVWLTPINWHLTEEEVAYVVKDSEARIVFCDAEHAALAERCAPERAVVVPEALDPVVAVADDAPMDPKGSPGGAMIYTSGTTGRPKGVKRKTPGSLRETLEAHRAGALPLGLDGDGPHLITGPCYHAAPLMFALYDQLSGAPIVILPRWNERDALQVLREREIAHTHLVPTMLVRLLRLPAEELAGFEAPALQVVLHGAAPISPSTKRAAIEWLGPVLVEYWGATESGVITLVDSREWLANPETVGRALPSWEVFAVGDDGETLPAGEAGTLSTTGRRCRRARSERSTRATGASRASSPTTAIRRRRRRPTSRPTCSRSVTSVASKQTVGSTSPTGCRTRSSRAA